VNVTNIKYNSLWIKHVLHLQICIILKICFNFTAPDLKVVDEQGHSVHDRYYKTGSTIELTCRVMTYNVQTTTPQVTWSKDGKNLLDKVTISHMRYTHRVLQENQENALPSAFYQLPT
jgi:hypothetical protein